MEGSLIREGLPMWTNENRAQYDRSKLRYPSDVTDAEWEHIASLIPPAKRGGRKRSVDVREIVNGLMYVLSTGCQWRYVPKDLPPRNTLFDYFDLWTWNGTLDRIHHAFYVKCREAMGREGGKLVLATLFGLHPFLRKLFADGGYQGPKFREAQIKILPLLITEIVKRSDQAQGFEVIPRRWVVERTFAWLGRCRRLAKDFENLTRNALAFIQLASIRLMMRKLC